MKTNPRTQKIRKKLLVLTLTEMTVKPVMVPETGATRCSRSERWIRKRRSWKQGLT